MPKHTPAPRHRPVGRAPGHPAGQPSRPAPAPRRPIAWEQGPEAEEDALRVPHRPESDWDDMPATQPALEEDEDEEADEAALADLAGDDLEEAPQAYLDALAEDEDDEYTAESYRGGHKLLMPSGKKLHVRPVSLIGLVQNGGVPNALLPAAKRMIYGKANLEAPRNRADARAMGQGATGKEREADETLQVINLLVAKMVSSFRVVNKAPGTEAHGEVSIHSMWEADKMALGRFAMRGQEALRPFRRQH